MIWAVTFEGVVCDRHAREKVVVVVGKSAMMSYGLNIDPLPVVCNDLQKYSTRTSWRHLRDQNPSRYPRLIRL